MKISEVRSTVFAVNPYPRTAWSPSINNTYKVLLNIEETCDVCLFFFVDEKRREKLISGPVCWSRNLLHPTYTPPPDHLQPSRLSSNSLLSKLKKCSLSIPWLIILQQTCAKRFKHYINRMITNPATTKQHTNSIQSFRDCRLCLCIIILPVQRPIQIPRLGNLQLAGSSPNFCLSKKPSLSLVNLWLFLD